MKDYDRGMSILRMDNFIFKDGADYESIIMAKRCGGKS
jgi:hypothetical protein